jgi:hypothetical protein
MTGRLRSAGIPLAASLLAFVVTVGFSQAAHAQSAENRGGQFAGSDHGSSSGAPAARPRRHRVPSRARAPVFVWHDYTFEGNDATGCWRRTTQLRPEAPPPEYSQQAVDQAFNELANNGILWGACPEDPARPSFDPAAAARLYWEEVVEPPTPEPLHIAPGYAITGLLAYLEIGGDPSPSWALDNPIGPDILITAKPRYVVHWGDRDAPPTRTTSRGRPWPGGPGEITHAYRYQGDTQVRVEAYWTGSWRLAGEGPSAGLALPELAVPTVGTLSLPVRQLQAVRNR